MGRAGAWAALAAASVWVLAGCAVVDRFSGRAVEYNLQAEQAQEQALLLNIVRASMRRPMQFTSLQSITGTASASANASVTGAATQQFPLLSVFNILPGNANTAISRIATEGGGATASVSGGPTFVVPVLDTQEFYQGILAPIPLQVVDYYLQQGYPPEVLFNVFVQKIEITRIDDGGCRQFTFLNSVRNDLQYGQYETFVDYLSASGLFTERVSVATSFGPPIAARTGAGADAVRVMDAYSKAATAGLDIRQEGATYRMEKKSSLFRLCFATADGIPSDWIGRPDSSMFCGHFNQRLVAPPHGAGQGAAAECRSHLGGPRSSAPAAEGYASQGVHTDGSAEFRGIHLSPEFLKRIDGFQHRHMQSGAINDDALFPVDAFRGSIVTIKFYTRSTEAILYYLGEVIRRRLFTEFSDQPRTIRVKTGIRHGAMPLGNCDDDDDGVAPVQQERHDLIFLSPRKQRRGRPGGRYFCDNLFVLDPVEGPGDHVITVAYDGKVFGIPRDTRVAGRTLQVLELTKQLLALNTSAKQLPATSVISITSP
jgi:hypothetical protein